MYIFSKQFYHVYTSSFGQGLLDNFVVIRRTEGQVLVTLYHIFVTFIIFSVFIALITSKFMTHYNRMVAEASLLRASIVLQLEKNLNKVDKQKLTRYYKQFCNPLVSLFSALCYTPIKCRLVTSELIQVFFLLSLKIPVPPIVCQLSILFRLYRQCSLVK